MGISTISLKKIFHVVLPLQGLLLLLQHLRRRTGNPAQEVFARPQDLAEAVLPHLLLPLPAPLRLHPVAELLLLHRGHPLLDHLDAVRQLHLRVPLLPHLPLLFLELRRIHSLSLALFEEYLLLVILYVHLQ